MKSFVFVLLFATMFSIGCDSTSSDTSTEYTLRELMQLKPGNSWTYRIQKYNINGSLTSTDSVRMFVDSLGTESGREGFYISGTEGNRFLYYEDSFLRTLNARRSIEFNYPMIPGTDFATFDTIYADDSYTKKLHRVVTNNTMVTVPAGTFDCVRYHKIEIYGATKKDRDTVEQYEVYLVSGIGKVREDYYKWSDSTRYLVSTTQLARYTVK